MRRRAPPRRENDVTDRHGRRAVALHGFLDVPDGAGIPELLDAEPCAP